MTPTLNGQSTPRRAQQAGVRALADHRPVLRHVPQRADSRAFECHRPTSMPNSESATWRVWWTMPLNSLATAWERADEIRRVYGYRDFSDPAASFRMARSACPLAVRDGQRR